MSLLMSCVTIDGVSDSRDGPSRSVPTVGADWLRPSRGQTERAANILRESEDPQGGGGST